MTLFFLLFACSGDKSGTNTPPLDSGDTEPTDSEPTVTTLPDTCGDPPAPPATRELGAGPQPARVLSGTGTWQLDFDAEAEALGFSDCSYTRTYEGVEFLDQPWLCADCEVMIRATATMTSGYDDCFLQIDDADAVRTELLGVGEVDGVPMFFRTGTDNVTINPLDVVTRTPGVDGEVWTASWSSDGELTDGGTMALSGQASLSVVESPTQTIVGLDGALTEPSSCGWPRNSPGGESPQRALVTGELVPNARLYDQCDEPVDLWDFRGYYLIIDASSPDCGPCQALAEASEAARSRLLNDCIPVEMVTLLNASLSGVNEPAALGAREEWADTFGLQSPVLADTGWGYALMPTYLNDDGFSLPSMIVVAPDGTVIGGSNGVPEEPFSELDTIIRDHFAR